MPRARLDKIFFFLAAGFPDQKFPANFFYKYEFWLQFKLTDMQS
jgi:hypothetical protein